MRCYLPLLMFWRNAERHVLKASAGAVAEAAPASAMFLSVAKSAATPGTSEDFVVQNVCLRASIFVSDLICMAIRKTPCIRRLVTYEMDKNLVSLS